MRKILVVEDDVTLRETIMLVLRCENYEVHGAMNGKEAIELNQANDYDLIITDILMPEMDGFEVIQYIRKHKPDTKLIAISGGGRVMAKDYLFIARNSGCSATLTKPFDNGDLLNKIRNVLVI